MTAATIQEQTPAPNAHLDAALTLQRKAAIVAGGAVDHAGRVQVVPIQDFDMQKTIFGSLQGMIPRTVMHDKLAKEPIWNDFAAKAVELSYGEVTATAPEPEVNPDLISFMHAECDFSGGCGLYYSDGDTCRRHGRRRHGDAWVDPRWHGLRG